MVTNYRLPNVFTLFTHPVDIKTLKGQVHVTVNKPVFSRIYIVAHTWRSGSQGSYEGARGLQGPGKPYVFHFFFVFSFPQGKSPGQRAHWPSKLSLCTEIEKDFPSKVMFPTVYRRACPPEAVFYQ